MLHEEDKKEDPILLAIEGITEKSASSDEEKNE
jgi:hypothetical protein